MLAFCNTFGVFYMRVLVMDAFHANALCVDFLKKKQHRRTFPEVTHKNHGVSMIQRAKLVADDYIILFAIVCWFLFVCACWFSVLVFVFVF